VEDVQGEINCTCCKSNTENTLDERNIDCGDTINGQEVRTQYLVDPDRDPGNTGSDRTPDPGMAVAMATN
jgi:hypothetical protein